MGKPLRDDEVKAMQEAALALYFALTKSELSDVFYDTVARMLRSITWEHMPAGSGNTREDTDGMRYGWMVVLDTDDTTKAWEHSIKNSRLLAEAGGTGNDD